MDINILLKLNYDDLLNICRIDKYINTICNNDYFWR